MQIISWKPSRREPSPSGFREVAEFNLALSNDLTLFDLCAVQAPDGSLKVYPPQIRGKFMAAISPAMRSQIIEMASAQMDCVTNEINR